MLDLIGNHIVGFPTRRLICNAQKLRKFSYVAIAVIKAINLLFYFFIYFVSNILLWEDPAANMLNFEDELFFLLLSVYCVTSC